MGALERWVRWLAGLPTHRGYYVHAESDPPEGVELGANWEGGWIDSDRWRPDAEGSLAASSAAQKVADSGGEELHPGSYQGKMTPAMVTKGTAENAEGMPGQRTVAVWDGDALAVTAGLGEDLWHVLTTEMSWSKLLTIEVVAEIGLVLGFAALMFAVALVASQDGETDAPGRLFLSKLLLAFSTVRISSDAIFGWHERDESGAVEVALVAVLGWLHWLLLSVMSSLIVARALKPQQQLVFAPDCVIGLNTWRGQRVMELQVRCMVLRPWYLTGLQDVQLKLTLSMTGVLYNLGLKGGISGIPIVTNPRLPIVLRHVVDEDSPIAQMPLGKEAMGMATILAHVGAEDMSGHRISQSASYMFQENGGLASKILGTGFTPRRVCLGAKYKDQIRYLFKSGRDRSVAGMADAYPMTTIATANFHKVLADDESRAELDALLARVADAKATPPASL